MKHINTILLVLILAVVSVAWWRIETGRTFANAEYNVRRNTILELAKQYGDKLTDKDVNDLIYSIDEAEIVQAVTIMDKANESRKSVKRAKERLAKIKEEADRAYAEAKQHLAELGIKSGGVGGDGGRNSRSVNTAGGGVP